MIEVEVTDAFWGPRRERLRTTTLPDQFEQMRRTGHLEALELKWKPGDEPVPHIFWESDLGKWLEAASYLLPDPGLEALVDEAIAALAGAQQPDGYLNAHFTVVEPGARFSNLRDAHELYCAGHLIEAAVAHFEATGKRSLLDVMCRYADLIVDEFAPGGAHHGGYCGHEEIELALVKLHRVTGDERYRALARTFIDERGTPYFEHEPKRRNPNHPARNPEYNQSHLPVREQHEVVGHAVRAMYLYCALADLATDDPTLRTVCERLWDHLVSARLYVTGGLGSSAENEGFTTDFDLPDRGYAETCAALGLVFWAQRMHRLTGEARYVDVLERALYNGVLSGLSEDGLRYFYVNPLASDGKEERHGWFDCACCPPNIARLLGSLGNYIYAATDDELTVNLFVASRARTASGVTLTQETDYPWDGRVRITVDTPAEFTLVVRIPGWCTDATLDGEPVAPGYARVRRHWQPGDTLELSLPMPARRVWADPRVTDAAGRVALMRGPLVYCLEGADHDGSLDALALPRDAELRAERRDGHVALVGTGTALDTDTLYASGPPRERPAALVAIPYHAWNNRGPGPMRVWIRER